MTTAATPLTCGSCGAELSSGAVFCLDCGVAVPPEQRRAARPARRPAWFEAGSAGPSSRSAGPADESITDPVPADPGSTPTSAAAPPVEPEVEPEAVVAAQGDPAPADDAEPAGDTEPASWAVPSPPERKAAEPDDLLGLREMRDVRRSRMRGEMSMARGDHDARPSGAFAAVGTPVDEPPRVEVEPVDAGPTTTRGVAPAIVAVVLLVAVAALFWMLRPGSEDLRPEAVAAWREGNDAWARGDIAAVCDLHDGIGAGGMWRDRSTCMDAEQEGYDQASQAQRDALAAMTVPPGSAEQVDGDTVVIWYRDAMVDGVRPPYFAVTDLAVMRRLDDQGWRQVGVRYGTDVVGSVPVAVLESVPASGPAPSETAD